MAKLYANENFPLPVIEVLRNLGHDVLTTMDVGKAGQGIPDEEVLEFATLENRILITLNRRDFIRLHNQNVTHSGIVACTADNDFNALAYRIHQAMLDESDFQGAVIRVNRPA